LSRSKLTECQERKKKTIETTDVFGILQYLDTVDHAVFEIKQTHFGGRFNCCKWAKSKGTNEFGKTV
jgi:hypothetical protein